MVSGPAEDRNAVQAHGVRTPTLTLTLTLMLGQYPATEVLCRGVNATGPPTLTNPVTSSDPLRVFKNK